MVYSKEKRKKQTQHWLNLEGSTGRDRARGEAGQGRAGQDWKGRGCGAGAERCGGRGKSPEVMEGGKKGDTRDKVSLKYCLKRPGGGSISVIFTVTLMKAFWG